MKFLNRIGRDPQRPPRRIFVVTSGRIRSGKSELAERIEQKLDATLVRTKSILIAEYGTQPQVRRRRRLQDLGEKLDKETDGRWVGAATGREIARLGPTTTVIVDSVRIPRQIEHLRQLAGARIIHVHLTARLKTLESRYAKTSSDINELPTYSEVLESTTEAQVDRMKKLTWLRFNTTYWRPGPLAIVVTAAIRLHAITEAAGQLALALALGAVFAAVLTLPAAWFWMAHLQHGTALLVSGITFAFFATLMGSALMRFSPIERDAPESASAPESPPPDRALPPSGPEVVRSRSLVSPPAS